MDEIENSRELNRPQGRELSWIFSGIRHSEHEESSSKPAYPAPHKNDEDGRQGLRLEYLAWMFAGVHIDSNHEDWDKLSPTEKDVLRAKLSRDQQPTDEQVG